MICSPHAPSTTTPSVSASSAAAKPCHELFAALSIPIFQSWRQPVAELLIIELSRSLFCGLGSVTWVRSASQVDLDRTGFLRATERPCVWSLVSRCWQTTTQPRARVVVQRSINTSIDRSSFATNWHRQAPHAPVAAGLAMRLSAGPLPAHV